VCVGAAMMAACGRAPVERTVQEVLAVPVAARPAEAGSIRTVVRASGVVTPTEGAEFLVVAPEAARVVEISKLEGAAVGSGEILVRFELPSATQNVTRLRAELAGAQEQLENAGLAQRRARDLVARGLLPRVDQEAADRSLADAQASVERAQTILAAAELAAARSVVRAPFAGIVAQRLHNPGDLVQSAATDPVLRVVDPRHLEVTASVARADISRVLPGATGRVSNPIDGRIIRLLVAPHTALPKPSADGTIPVRLEFAEPADVPVDSRVDVEIDAEERSNVVFVVPEAIVRENGQIAVLVAIGDRAERRTVTTGLTDEQRVEITSGLQRGELVITQGHIGLRDGAKITIATR